MLAQLRVIETYEDNVNKERQAIKAALEKAKQRDRAVELSYGGMKTILTPGMSYEEACAAYAQSQKDQNIFLGCTVAGMFFSLLAFLWLCGA